MKPLETTISEMKRMAEFLTPHTWPLAEFEVEQDILCLKQRIITFDGYEINICLSRADYGKYSLDSLQIQSCHGPFLPFIVVCNVGRAFFGDTLLSYIDFFRNDKKIYCWVIKHKDEEILPTFEANRTTEFEGYKYQILNSESVELF